MLRKINPSCHRKVLAVLVANILSSGFAIAAESVFELGAIQVTAKKNQIGEVGEEQVASLVTRKDMLTFPRHNAADAVNLLAAIVLYVLAASNVRGFAFTLGVTTLIDLAVVFLFTHPLVAILAHTK